MKFGENNNMNVTKHHVHKCNSCIFDKNPISVGIDPERMLPSAAIDNIEKSYKWVRDLMNHWR